MFGQLIDDFLKNRKKKREYNPQWTKEEIKKLLSENRLPYKFKKIKHITKRSSKMQHATEQNLEKEIQEKGLDAPRLNPDHIDSVIEKCEFHIFKGSQLTVCCLTLKNGFTVTGESACASPENFDKEIGEKVAARNAREKIWVLEGYLLKQKLFDN